jgi:HAD superfamily hydrolase (TIGR01509 family)
MKPELIIFDFDGVLVDTQAIVNKIERDWLLRHGMQMSLEEFTKRFSGMKASTIIETLRRENNVELMKNLREVVKDIDDTVFAELSKQKIKPIEGVKDVLQNHAFKKCVASNCSLRILRSLLLTSNLAQYFNGNIFSADMVQRPKPYPDLFFYASRNMNAEAKQCLVIEDSEVGVKAAVAAGMRVWGFLAGNHIDSETHNRLLRTGAERTFQDMALLPKFLEQE